MNELRMIQALKNTCPSNASVILGIDDDAAILHPTLTETLVCADMLMDGVHFELEKAGAAAVGHKALAVNLSDIAAMGGTALSAFISLAIPRAHADEAFLGALYSGINDLARRFNVAVAGGDTNIWDGPFVINVTVLGQAHSKGPVRRSGAEAGDVVFVTGPLGGSIESHHLGFTPRLDEARALMDAFAIRSMMDLSDGLGKDLRTLCEQSGVSAHIDAGAIPLRANIQSLPKSEALKKAFCDGEDFELCFTVSGAEAEHLKSDPRFSSCIAIGTIGSGAGLYWSHDQSPIPWHGYEHGSLNRSSDDPR